MKFFQTKGKEFNSRVKFRTCSMKIQTSARSLDNIIHSKIASDTQLKHWYVELKIPVLSDGVDAFSSAWKQLDLHLIFPELADSDRGYPCRGSIIPADDFDASGRTEPEAAQMG